MAKKKSVKVNMNYPIYVYLLDDNPYRDNVIVNGIKITTDKTLISSAEMMGKLKSIESYLCIEPVTE